MDQTRNFEKFQASSRTEEDFLPRLVEKVQEINANGITRTHQDILNNRLDITWTTATSNVAKASTTLWRIKRARRFYTAVQDVDDHLFLAVILLVSPTECSTPRFDNILNHLTNIENCEPYHITLPTAAKSYFEIVAERRGFANSHGYLKFLQALFPRGTLNADSQLRKRKRYTPPAETQGKPAPSLTHPRFTGPPEVIENASIEGIAKVFNGYVCRAIRIIKVQNDMKAVVTTVLPLWGGPVDCLISLDICESEVAQLAMALFNAKVIWVDDVLHVALKEGTMLVIPHSEATLKGALDEDIIKVFGSEIHAAVTESPVRKRELAEGKRATEGVSMILTKTGGIVNLSLGLEGGLEIQNKLYT